MGSGSQMSIPQLRHACLLQICMACRRSCMLCYIIHSQNAQDCLHHAACLPACMIAAAACEYYPIQQIIIGHIMITGNCTAQQPSIWLGGWSHRRISTSHAYALGFFYKLATPNVYMPISVLPAKLGGKNLHAYACKFLGKIQIQGVGIGACMGSSEATILLHCVCSQLPTEQHI